MRDEDPFEVLQDLRDLRCCFVAAIGLHGHSAWDEQDQQSSLVLTDKSFKNNEIIKGNHDQTNPP